MHNCFALDQYEAYETIVARPQLIKGNIYPQSYQLIKLKWKDVEPERSSYQLDVIEQQLAAAAQHPYLVLWLEPGQPDWVEQDHNSAHFAAFIRKVGSAYGEDARLFAVVATMLGSTTDEWEAYADSFQAPYLLANVQDSAFIQQMRAQKRSFGLWLTATEDNWLACSEQIAKQRLGSIWKEQPVLLAVPEQKWGEELRNEAKRWHVALCGDADASLGARLALRRVTFPAIAYAGGHFPLRLWFVNDGSAKFYRPFKLWLRLHNEQENVVMALQADTSSWLTGDLVHNELLCLPDLPSGTYEVAIGVTYDDGAAVNMYIQEQDEDGFYHAGQITIAYSEDDPYRDIWKSYYPEGYYPLEDPQVPE
ncbi:hypothetical protein J40TS1_39540 [Paenibacillus montaniterrae]|uniref:DUF4832 domain-containing protein n=1 Tax=Paenibacillus montaniterrae TaxID=429341 RepID=A0A919YSB1_9BACL|nr:DUF4832 domain-containing protein [Paenibacillus montaniterrae]GIP18312.1 hypothetical protein J40TS1_39540 [Paenibacillus montaniterrae]